MKLLSFGEVLYDVYPDKSCIGGAPLNLASHFSLLGGEAFVMSAVGEDDLGKKAVEEMKSMGINTKYIARLNDKITGRCDVTLDKNFVPSYDLKNDVAYDYIDADTLNEEFDVLVFGTLALRGKHNTDAIKKVIKSEKIRKIYTDLNIRPPFYSKESVMLCLENSDIVKISDEELPIVCKLVFGEIYGVKDAFVRLKEKFPKLEIIIITAGKDGSYAYDIKNDKVLICKAEKVEVVSTVGAGDSFGAAFLFKYFNGNDLCTCMDFASQVSGFVVSNKEAVPSNMKEFLDSIK